VVVPVLLLGRCVICRAVGLRAVWHLSTAADPRGLSSRPSTTAETLLRLVGGTGCARTTRWSGRACGWRRCDTGLVSLGIRPPLPETSGKAATGVHHSSHGFRMTRCRASTLSAAAGPLLPPAGATCTTNCTAPTSVPSLVALPAVGAQECSVAVSRPTLLSWVGFRRDRSIGSADCTEATAWGRARSERMWHNHRRRATYRNARICA
jgi:hypothetical protein